MVKHKTQAAFPKIFFENFSLRYRWKIRHDFDKYFFQKLVSKDKTALCTSFYVLIRKFAEEVVKDLVESQLQKGHRSRGLKLGYSLVQ